MGQLTLGAQLSPGAWLAHREAIFYNRTGATLYRGQPAMIDIGVQAGAAQSETTSLVPGAEGSVYANLTPVLIGSPSTGGLEGGIPIVLAMQDIPDNSFGRCCICSPYVEAQVQDDDVSTNDIDRGDAISMLPSDTNGALGLCALVVGLTNGCRQLGIALEDAAASSATAARTATGSATSIASAHFRHVCWFGGLPGAGSIIDT